MDGDRKSVYLQEYRSKSIFADNGPKTLGPKGFQPAVVFGKKDIPPFRPE